MFLEEIPFILLVIARCYGEGTTKVARRNSSLRFLYFQESTHVRTVVKQKKLHVPTQGSVNFRFEKSPQFSNSGKVYTNKCQTMLPDGSKKQDLDRVTERAKYVVAVNSFPLILWAWAPEKEAS